ncbi:unnamed protein product [Prorocentrum cordatum]|uniref:Uncharacterized protein n=1 Tax=Prorocentrum cordatum TaxID=2364126 RepID=A0ABN9Q2E8_9DINO|nr:unnamed protein product [Polarella glacialis]
MRLGAAAGLRVRILSFGPKFVRSAPKGGMVRGAPVKQPGAAEGAPHASRDCVRSGLGARRPALGLRVCLGSEPRRCRGAAPRAGRAGRRAPATRGGAAARRDAHGGRRPAPRRRRAARRLAGRPGAGDRPRPPRRRTRGGRPARHRGRPEPRGAGGRRPPPARGDTPAAAAGPRAAPAPAGGLGGRRGSARERDGLHEARSDWQYVSKA